MPIYRPGQILLVVFPYTDASGAKQRPALVLHDVGDDDVLVCRITTQIQNTRFDVEITKWRKAGLLGPSVTRVHKLATLEKTLVRKTLGELHQSDFDNVARTFKKLGDFLIL